ncbi:GNAT family N-acetyltransferase [Salegentibacter sediminis]|uniref:GNAT family N-acetyltransferase n=1 Tax=Salegentibacter sediminis TaxID=1930251 RepID=UPI0009BEABFF|nr:GNAT family N-acetyltransferase [Salegentibacter sediminis]
MNDIKYKVGMLPKISEIIEVYDNSGIKRPTKDSDRIAKMYENSNLIITAAWLNNELIGISRSITDFCYACYLSDLAVKSEYQKAGIGKQLIKLTEKEIGEETALILLSAPMAMEYYPKIGFKKVNNGFIIPRTK